MGWLKKRAIIAAAVVVFLVIGVTLCVIGYNLGHGRGYELNKVEGYDEGYEKGYPVGRAAAISEGFLSNPTYQEMKDFLRHDTTDTKHYDANEYDSRDMVADINKNAEAQGIRAARVYIEFAGHSYTLVAFETTDEGLIFIHPWDDNEMKVGVGIKYWEDNGYEKPDYDDTIKRFIVCW